MNERIDELMMQSGARLDAWGRVDLDDFQYKKFAELIVKECIGCCEEVADINKTYIEEKFVDPEFGPKECIEVIKKHFGVEE